MSVVVFRRLSSAPPPERELLTVDEAGTFRMWRSLGPMVGRFAGTLPDPARLAGLAAAAGGAAPPSGPGELPSGASVDFLEVENASSARVEAQSDVPGPWGALLDACRQLLGDLTAQPLAAVALHADDPARPRLDHRGQATLPLELDSATVTVELWRDGVQAVVAGSGPLGLGRVDAGPGWSVTVDIGAVDVSGGGLLTARASLVADDEGVFVPLTLFCPPVRLEPS
jgi:hypothetical protein